MQAVKPRQKRPWLATIGFDEGGKDLRCHAGSNPKNGKRSDHFQGRLPKENPMGKGACCLIETLRQTLPEPGVCEDEDDSG